MRGSIIYIICVAILGASAAAAAATAPTITVFTEPPELEIWLDGERVGVGEAVLFGPFDDYVEVTVRGKGYAETTEIVDPPMVEGEDVIVVIASERKRWFSMGSLGVGFGIGLAVASSILLFGLIAD
jgi:hypothetical protein